MRHGSNVTTAAAGLGALLALSGCGASTVGSAAPAPGTTSATYSPSKPPTTEAPKKLLAPHVEKPLDASNYLSQKQICKILDKDQLKQLGLSNPTGDGKKIPDLAASCDYKSHQSNIAVSFKLSDNDGLSATYADRADMKYWNTTSIQGHPAVLADRTDGRPNGICVVNVGINDQRSFSVQYGAIDSSLERQACENVKQAANLVITSLIKYPNP